jgi:tetratricopeptide (TPR) repeat protein
VRFTGAVHEQLVCDRPGLRFEIHPSTIVLHHHGYRPEYADPVTLERDREALEAAVREQPGEPFHAYNLGCTYRALGMTAEAEGEFLRTIALCAPGLASGVYPHFMFGAYQALAEIRLDRGLPADAAALCERALALRPDSPDVHMALGAALARLGRLEEAAAAYERALACAGAPAHSPTDRSAGRWRAQLGLAEVLSALGRREEAAACLAQARAAAPSHPLVRKMGERLGGVVLPPRGC